MSTKPPGSRNCPVCKSGLRAIQVGDATIDFCPHCRGSWFDTNELHGVYEHRDSLSALLLPALPNLQRDPVLCKQCGTYSSRAGRACSKCKARLRFSCPGCDKPLEEGNRSGLVLDYCNYCKGVWLDGGELKILFEQYSKAVQKRTSAGEVAVAGAAAADMALDMFIWAPDLYIAATAQVLTHLPELASKGIELAGDMPEIAGKAAEGLITVAGSASELATTAISGAIEVAGSVGSVASETAASFIEVILDLVSGIFD